MHDLLATKGSAQGRSSVYGGGVQRHVTASRTAGAV